MKFQVFRNGKAVNKFTLCGAYLFGTDGIAIRRGRIAFKNGFIECDKPTLEAAGLALLWPIEGFGGALLPTTCLPERTRPYNLNVEIARAKLMQIINKREDWSFFDNLKEFGGISKEAQSLFVEAVQNISDAPLASKLADESLKRAVLLSEKLAIKQANSLFTVRRGNRGFGRGCLCCKVDPERVSDSQYIDKLLELFSFLTIPVSWASIEPRRGEYDFSAIDKCINVLGSKKVAMSAGPLLCFSKEDLPRWLSGGVSSFEKVREAAYHFVSNTVSRYSGRIHAWRVISGMNAFNHFGFSFEQVLEMTRAANMAVKAASERAVKIIVISNPWGEYYAKTPNTIPPLVYMDMVVQGGISFDAFGLEMRFGRNEAGMHVRDMMQISAILDYFGPVGKPLYIVDVEVPGQVSGLTETDSAGIVQERWDQGRQGRWIEHFYKIALGKPFVDTVTYSHLADTKGSIIPDSGLLTDGLEAKESFLTLKKMQKLIFSR